MCAHNRDAGKFVWPIPTLVQTLVRTSIRFPHITVTDLISFFTLQAQDHSHAYSPLSGICFPHGDRCACGMSEDAVRNLSAKKCQDPFIVLISREGATRRQLLEGKHVQARCP